MSGFRTHFGRLSRNLNWFPKHMNTGLRQMQAKLRSVDCILELHDSRIPFSGRNPNFSQNLVGDKPHILIFNKVDLITRESARRIRSIMEEAGTKHVIFTNCKDDQDSGIKKITPLMVKLIEDSDRYHRTGTQEYHAMIIGVPNVGKSSFINMLRAKNLRKARALKVGPSAGVTKCVHEKVKISEDPPIFLFDTPGILTPRIDGDETGMKLAVCGNLQDHGVGAILIADYVLFCLNKNKSFRYVKFMGLEEPCDCITTVLAKGALHRNIIQQFRAVDKSEGLNRKPDLERMALIFTEKFRSGDFGKVVLDDLDDDAATNFISVNLYKNEVFLSS